MFLLIVSDKHLKVDSLQDVFTNVIRGEIFTLCLFDGV